MERPIIKPVGTPVEQLDTPALVVDLDILEQNIETMHSFFRLKDAKLRPHIESHRSPAIAHKQLRAGGTVGGICVSTIGQAEVFAASGFTDIFVANLVVTPLKIARLCYLAKQVRMTVAVDGMKNVDDLSEAASSKGVVLDVVVYVHTRLNSLGVEPGQPAVDMAKTIANAEGLRFAGLMTYEGLILDGGPEQTAPLYLRCIQKVLDTREMVEKAGIDVSVVCVGGTYNYEIAGTTEGVTDVLAGTYALMDQRYRNHRTEFRPAARIMATVTSRPEKGLMITDGGQKAIGADTGLPSVDNVSATTVKSLSAEHGSIFFDESENPSIDLGDKIWHTPWDIGTCVNLHDYMSGIRDGVLEVVWDVQARGRYQ